jgi:hypothetical protein
MFPTDGSDHDLSAPFSPVVLDLHAQFVKVQLSHVVTVPCRSGGTRLGKRNPPTESRSSQAASFRRFNCCGNIQDTPYCISGHDGY